LDLSRLFDLSSEKTYSLSAENPDGAAGGGARATEGPDPSTYEALGEGWKVRPFASIPAGSTFELANIRGGGVITHVWMVALNRDDPQNSAGLPQELTLQAYWDDDERAAVDVPLGDFFCQGSRTFAQVSSAMVAANSASAFNSYWPMPFRSNARLCITNNSASEVFLAYQVTYETRRHGDDLGYFHARWNRSAPVRSGGPHVLVEKVRGRGKYVGTFMSVTSRSEGWWGEGEFKFYLDGDREYPTICGTGTEDYFGGGACLVVDGAYATYSTPFLGFTQALRAPDAEGLGQFSLYRWHILDPIHFTEGIERIDVQDLGVQFDVTGWVLREDDIATTAIFYLDESS
jgi:hypothetical protein